MRLDPKIIFQKIFNSSKTLFVLIILIIISSLLSERFFTINNMLTILRQVSIIGLLAIGQTYVILSSGIDLSVGSVLALCIVVIAGTISVYGMAAGMVAGILVGLVAGLINGLGITIGKVPAFIMTLGMLTFARGLAYIYTAGNPIQITHRLYYILGNSYLWIIPVPVIIYLVVLVLSAFVLEKTPFGRKIYAIGTNAKAAKVAGIDVKKNLIYVYIFSGFCVSLSAIMFSSQLGLGTPVAGSMYELDAIAAVVVGGNSLFGGRGTLFGTFIGTLILGVLSNILNLRGVDPFIKELLIGVIIIIAVLFTIQSSRAKLA